MSVDIRTVLIVIATIETALCLLFLLGFQIRRPFPGTWHWLSSIALMAAVCFSVNLLGIFPDRLVRLLVPLGSWLAIELINRGGGRFFKFKHKFTYTDFSIKFMLIFIFILSIYIESPIDGISSPNLRALLGGLSTAYLSGTAARNILGMAGTRQQLSAYLIGVPLLLLTALSTLRVPVVLLRPMQSTILQAGRAQTVVMLLMMAVVIACTFGMLLAVSQRLELELEEKLVELNESEGRLRLAKEAAEHAALVKTQFLANMSHEIRTPMNAILGLSRIGLDEEPPAPFRDYLTKINAAALGLLGVINDILDVSKLEAGKLVLSRDAIDLDELVVRCRELLAQKAADRGIGLEITIDEGLPRALFGDRLRLGQVLTNLLSNAVKFTERGQVRLAIVRVPMPRPRRSDRLKLRFSVSDTGIGMSEEQQRGLFLPFSQVDASNTRRFGGTGLGLSIVRQLVELMGGEIHVVSKLDSGSTFSFEIVLEIDTERAALGKSQEQGATGRSSISASGQVAAVQPDAEPPLRGLHVLLVEDNLINQLVAQKLLERAEVKVTVCTDGQAALDRLRATPDAYDLVFMDVQMSPMDGHEATRQIRGALGLRTLPIVAMTAHALAEERERCLASGMNDHLSKPIDRSRLLAILQKWTQKPAGPAATENS